VSTALLAAGPPHYDGVTEDANPDKSYLETAFNAPFRSTLVVQFCSELYSYGTAPFVLKRAIKDGVFVTH
jgi:hypothetical protein